MNSTELKKPEFDRTAFDRDFEAFTKRIPSVISAANPDPQSKKEQMADFFRGEIYNPKCVYPKLEALSDEQIILHEEVAQSLKSQLTELSDIERSVYENFIDNNLLQAKLLVAMRDYNNAESEERKIDATSRFMDANIALYGEPDRSTYHSLLQEKIIAISSKELSHGADKILQELKLLVPDWATDTTEIVQRFRPAAETVEWMNKAVHGLYDGMLKHIPDTDEDITAEGFRDILEAIIAEEFAESAEGWHVVMKDAKSISVGAKSKVIIIPTDRQPMSVAEVRRLVVHEIGIHMLTAITGESTNIPVLAHGLADYYDTQEGLGKVVEQAIDGEFKEAGIDHYITAGLAYFDHMDFQLAVEIKWRLKLLQDIEPGLDPTPDQIDFARKTAADGPLIAATRIYRGTDELPLFKDLSYYNGSVNVWKYIESIRGDDFLLSLLLAGKINTSRDHMRVILESRSV